MTTSPFFLRMALFGCGHIGGSVALGLKQAGAVSEITGLDISPPVAEKARTLGIIDRVATSAADAVRDADLVVLAAPVRSIGVIAEHIAPILPRGAVVTDVGSTKQSIVKQCEAVLGGRFVGSHPLAGTERAGPEAAAANLFLGRKVLVTATSVTEEETLSRIIYLWRAIGAKIVELPTVQHDALLALISHLPHIAAYSLAGTIGDDEADDLAGLSGGGFADTTRIASTPPPMWVDIFLENREMILPLVDRFVAQIGLLRTAIETGDETAIVSLLARARATRERILAR